MKSKTHVFMANLLMGDLERGVISLPGIGNFTPPQEIKNAVLKYPGAFRAGAIGPDFYPDMIMGQTLIHPENSGMWLDLMFQKSLNWNGEEGERVRSFLLGYMLHYAGDMFGHAYVNSYAGGWFPSFKEITRDLEKAKIVLRHMLVESYMDQKVPADEPMELNAPIEYLAEVFSSGEAMGIYKKFSGSVPNIIQDLIQLRNDVHITLQDTAIGLMPGITNYVQHWAGDIETAYLMWLKDWARTAAVAVSNDSNKISQTKKLFEEWLVIYLTSACGLPDVIGKFFKFLNDLDVLKPLKDLLMQLFKEYLFALLSAAGIKVADIQKAIDAIQAMFKDPKLYLDNGILFKEKNVSAKLDKDFGNYGKERDTCRQDFDAVSQCLNMSKLCLAGSANLNAVVSRAGGNIRYNETYRTFSSVAIRRVRIKTADKLWAGTDNNVYFGVVYEGGRRYEVLCDKPGYNDFERGDNDVYPFAVPEKLRLDRVEKFFVRMSGNTAGGDWDFAWAEVYDDKSKVLFKVNANKCITTGNTYEFTPERCYADETVAVPFDISIMSFLYSLDGKGRSDANPATEAQWQINFPFYSESVLREKIFKPLFGVNTSDLPALAVFKSCHGKYLSAQPDGRAEWNRDAIGPWEKVFVESCDRDKAALRSCHGRYLSAQPDGRVEWNRDAIGPWETWTVEDKGADVFALKSCHGKYLSAHSDGSVSADKTAVSAEESFSVPAFAVFKSCHGKYLSAQPDGRAEWNRDAIGPWEKVFVESCDRDKAALRSCHGRYLSAQPDGRVEWNRDVIGPWETWTVEDKGADVFALKSCHGKYLSAHSDGSVSADKTAVSSEESFSVSAVS